VKISVTGIGSFMENLASLLILAGTGYIACLYPWETFWWLLNGLTWLTWWIIKLSICASVLCVAGLLLEEKWHQWFPKKIIRSRL
jgi:hypothetical protein